MEKTQKEEIVSILETLLDGIQNGDIEFLGFIREKKPKYDPRGMILKVRKSEIETVTFQYKQN